MATRLSWKERDHRRHGCLDYSAHTGVSPFFISKTDLNSIERFTATETKKGNKRYIFPLAVSHGWIMQCIFLCKMRIKQYAFCLVVTFEKMIKLALCDEIFSVSIRPENHSRSLESRHKRLRTFLKIEIARDKRIWIIPCAYAYPFWYPILLERSTLCHPPQTLVFHLSRRTELLTAQGIGVLPRKRFVASVLGRRQREYLVTYVRQLAGGIKENFCSKVCFLRSAVARL